jgi:hypothetical protein
VSWLAVRETPGTPRLIVLAGYAKRDNRSREHDQHANAAKERWKSVLHEDL